MQNAALWGETLRLLVEMAATAAFALSGILAGARQRLDAVGLDLFAATGAHQALLQDLPALVAVLMGLFTGVAGGVLRDVVCNEIPTAFATTGPARPAPSWAAG